MHHQTAFLSEWGNNALDFSKKGPSGILPTTHFIVTAHIMDKADLAAPFSNGNENTLNIEKSA